MSDEDSGVEVVAGDPGRRPRSALALGVALGLLVGVVIGRVTAGAADGQGTEPAAPRAADAGPRRVAGGVPAGYGQTREGSVAALLNYSVVLSGLVLRPDAERAAALRAMATDGLARELGDRLTRARAQADGTAVGRGLDGGARTVYRGVPLGYRVVRYDPGEAVVELWALGVVANDAGLGPQMTFQSSTSVLRWEGGDWKLAGSVSRPGPTPAVTGVPSSGRAFVQEVGRLTGVRFEP